MWGYGRTHSLVLHSNEGHACMLTFSWKESLDVGETRVFFFDVVYRQTEYIFFPREMVVYVCRQIITSIFFFEIMMYQSQFNRRYMQMIQIFLPSKNWDDEYEIKSDKGGRQHQFSKRIDVVPVTSYLWSQKKKIKISTVSSEFIYKISGFRKNKKKPFVFCVFAPWNILWTWYALIGIFKEKSRPKSYFQRVSQYVSRSDILFYNLSKKVKYLRISRLGVLLPYLKTLWYFIDIWCFF